ncbi:MAG: glycerophosphodiester phosphodiesterase, partial [Thermomicrobiales bacterium]
MVEQNQHTVILGHRGAPREAPENTLAAFRRAFAYDIDGVETDVQRSADGQLVLIHDDRVDRTTSGHGNVGDLTWDELRALDAGQGERIPSLDEL